MIVTDTVTIHMPRNGVRRSPVRSSLADPATRRWLALGAVLLVQLMIVLDATIVNVALPAIQRDLGFGQASLTWVVNGYLITFGSFLLVAGRLGDLVGRRNVLVAGLVVFTAASALCGLAADGTTLVAARFVQGLGGAFGSAVILAIIATEFPEAEDRARAMSAYMFVSVGGGSLGLLAGGALTQAIDWHWIFFVNAPIGALTLLATLALVEDRPGLGLREGVDVLGAVLVTAAMAIGVYAIVEAPVRGWDSGRTLGLGALAIVLLGIFGAVESRLARPILPLALLRIPTFAGSSLIRAMLGVGMYGAFFLGTLYLERVQGYDSVQTGVAFLPWTLSVAVLSLGPTAWLVRRAGSGAVLVGGLVTTVIGLVLLSRAGADDAYFPSVFVPFVLVGAGIGTVMMPLLTLALADVPARDAGVASAVVNVSLYVSSAVGLAALGAIATERTQTLTEHGQRAGHALLGGYHLAFTVSAACMAACAAVAVVVLAALRSSQARAVAS